MRLRSVALRAAAAERAWRYDRWQNREARTARAVIEKQHPEARLDRPMLRRVREYAGDVLGSPRFAPWLETYTAWRQEFREGWIPDNYFGRIVLPRLPGPVAEGRFGGAKTLARQMLGGTDLLPDRASFVHGAWLDGTGNPIGEAEAVAAIFAEDDVAILKHDGSLRGQGVYKIHKDTFRPAEHVRRGNFVVQAWIRQASELAAFAPSSVATIRVTTAKHDGARASLRCAYLRLGRDGSDAVRSAAAVRVAITDEEGRLAPVGALTDWQSVTAHPDSGIAFAGFRVPAFAEAASTARALHDRVPHVAHVGWDFAVDAEGRMRLMEWNPGHADIKFSEAANGPHFADFGWERLA